MKIERFKIAIGALAGLFVVVHFLLISIYAMPPQLMSEKAQNFAAPYVEPIFTQKWSMFAPCPIVDGVVEVNYYYGEDSTGWLRPTQEAAEKHAYWRGAHYGELVLGEANLTYWFGLDFDPEKHQRGALFPGNQRNEFFTGYSYFKIKHYAGGFSRYLYDQTPDSCKTRFILENVVTETVDTIEIIPFVYQ